jgi:hypothetical protein
MPRLLSLLDVPTDPAAERGACSIRGRVSGGPGKPRGYRVVLSEAFLRDMLSAGEQRGAQALEVVPQTQADVFYQKLSRI